MRNVAKQNAIFQALPQLNKQQLKAVLRNSSPAFVKAVCEISLNLLKSNLPLTPCQHKKFKKHKKLIRSLATRGDSLDRKKRLINQKGGFAFLPLLAPLLASAIGGVIGKAVGKRI
jgi:hypothetical protein